jgi:four helix bundle protein
MRAFTELRVWQLGHETVLETYRCTEGFPDAEKFGLTAQLRRAASAVPANIAEGSRARHPADFARILNTAEKEASEATYHVILARDLGYISEEDAGALLKRFDLLGRMLNRLYAEVRDQARVQRNSREA